MTYTYCTNFDGPDGGPAMFKNDTAILAALQWDVEPSEALIKRICYLLNTYGVEGPQ